VSVDLSFLQALILSYFLPANMFVVLNLLLLWYFAKVLPIIVIPAYLQQGDYLSFILLLELGALNLLAYLKYGLTILFDTGMPLILAFALGMFFYQTSIKLALQYGEVVENCLELSKET